MKVREVNPQIAAHLRAAKVLAKQQRTIPLGLDIAVVFERQRNHVLRRQIEIAGANQESQAAGVGEIDRGDDPLLIGPRQKAQRLRPGRQHGDVGRLG